VISGLGLGLKAKIFILEAHGLGLEHDA